MQSYRRRGSCCQKKKTLKKSTATRLLTAKKRLKPTRIRVHAAVRGNNGAGAGFHKRRGR